MQTNRSDDIARLGTLMAHRRILYRANYGGHFNGWPVALTQDRTADLDRIAREIRELEERLGAGYWSL